MTKYTRKNNKLKNKTKRKRNNNKRTKRRKRSTRKGGVFSKLKEKAKGMYNTAKGKFNSTRESFNKAKDITFFLNNIPSYNQKILMNKLLTLSLDDSPEELNKLEVQKKKYIDDLYGEKVDKKILENHPLNVTINNNNLSSEKLKEHKSQAFKTKDDKPPVVLLESGPKKTDKGKSYTSQLYVEYKGDENASSEKVDESKKVEDPENKEENKKGGRSRKMKGGVKYNQKGGASVEVKNQYVSHSKIGNIFAASNDESKLKEAVDTNESVDGIHDRDTFGVKNLMPEVKSYYIPTMNSEYKNLYENVIEEKNVDNKDKLDNKTQGSDNNPITTQVDTPVATPVDTSSKVVEAEPVTGDNANATANVNADADGNKKNE